MTAQEGAQILYVTQGPQAGTPLAPASAGIAYHLPNIINIPSFTVVPAQSSQILYVALGPQAGTPLAPAGLPTANYLPRAVDGPSFAVSHYPGDTALYLPPRVPKSIMSP